MSVLFSYQKTTFSADDFVNDFFDGDPFFGQIIQYKGEPPTIVQRAEWGCEYCGAKHPTTRYKCHCCGGPRR